MLLNMKELIEASLRAKAFYARWRELDVNTTFDAVLKFWRYALMVEESICALKDVGFPNTEDHKVTLAAIEKCVETLYFLHTVNVHVSALFGYEDQNEYERWFSVRVSEDTLLILMNFPLYDISGAPHATLRRMTDGTPIIDATAIHPKNLTRLFDTIIDQQLDMLEDDEVSYIARTERAEEFLTFLKCFNLS